MASIVVPAGAMAVSDAVDFDVPGGGELAVSVYLPEATEPATFHEKTMQTSYVTGTGNFVGATDLPGATTTFSTFYVSAVEVLPAESIARWSPLATRSRKERVRRPMRTARGRTCCRRA
jgi:hypothetical protein